MSSTLAEILHSPTAAGLRVPIHLDVVHRVIEIGDLQGVYYRGITVISLSEESSSCSLIGSAPSLRFFK